jgi:eukaryotic-like serine/threonine-protein kinase
MTNGTPEARPAAMITGLVLDGGWTVLSRIERAPHGTGGAFSCCYRVVHEKGRQGFLKALDFADALQEPDPARFLQLLTEAFNFERDVLDLCRGNGMDRGVSSITDGKITISGAPAGGVVQYLIFELADGDIRNHLGSNKQCGVTWKLRSLHHIATGLLQLHGKGVAHQDIKPSNVLVFNEALSKVGDLGRAARKGFAPPHEPLPCAGDLSYGPPERLYGFEDGEWTSRRIGCDCYLLGSLVVFLFCGVSMTHLLFDYLPDEHHWETWDGTFGEVLPYLRQGFDEAIEDFGSVIVNKRLRDLLVPLVRELCDPDPRLRGDKINRARGGNPFSLERYVTRLDLMARRAARGDYEGL